jgi:hypothetical protein
LSEPRQARRRIVVELCKQFPDAPARTLARKLAREHPKLFQSIDMARCAVRFHFGLKGNQKYPAGSAGIRRPARKPGYLPPLPESHAKSWEPFPIVARRILVVSDLHFPFHDVEAIECALAYGETFKPDAILVNGDLIDFERISRFDYDPHGPSTGEAGRFGFVHGNAASGRDAGETSGVRGAGVVK